MLSQQQTCSNAACSFGSDSKCVEGYALDECPHLSAPSVKDIAVVEEHKVEPEPARKVMSLAAGLALQRADASEMQRRHVSRVIGLVGPNESGKTSLIAGLYDLFQAGPVAGVGFAGSTTLVGLEKTCHDARAASRRTAPHTERTSSGADATFFHLDLAQTSGNVRSLFIGNRSGEDYLAATDQLVHANEFFELRRADCITLLVNGEQLADGTQRHEVKAATPQIIDALIESKAIRKGCRLAIVLTKKDAVLKSPHAERAQREFEGLVHAISTAHSAHLGEIQHFVVAASPKDSELVPRGDGVGDLLLYWLEAPTPSTVPGPEPHAGFDRMFDRFAVNQDGIR